MPDSSFVQLTPPSVVFQMLLPAPPPFMPRTRRR
jgi:hypothetical protein